MNQPTASLHPTCHSFNNHEDKVVIQGVEIYLSRPDTPPSVKWIGQRDVLDQLLASWMIIHPDDLPLQPRLVGKPGVGKTTVVSIAAKMLNLPLYIFQCTIDTRPEDLLITPVIDKSGNIKYAASSLVSAMIRGGICILDEGNRMSEKAWASLAPLLDSRRYIESIVAGIKIHAHSDFRIATTTNDDATTFELPEYILSRLKPEIFVDFPNREEEKRIMRENLPFVEEEVIDYVVAFLQNAHMRDEKYSVRDGINIARYAAKRLFSLSHKEISAEEKLSIIRQAITMTLGESSYTALSE